jgi:hypothetical protein
MGSTSGSLVRSSLVSGTSSSNQNNDNGDSLNTASEIGTIIGTIFGLITICISILTIRWSARRKREKENQTKSRHTDSQSGGEVRTSGGGAAVEAAN